MTDEQTLRAALAEIGLIAVTALSASVPDEETQDTYLGIKDIVDSALGADGIANYQERLGALTEAVTRLTAEVRRTAAAEPVDVT